MQSESGPLVGLVVSETTFFTLDEFSCACTVQVEHIVALVEEGILEPVDSDSNSADLRFSGDSLRRARIALRLQRELEVNLAGVALALDLMDEIQQLRCRLQRLERGLS